ncbi:MAG: hypothetical protein MZV64_19055 [Ignavibacteriales bacterium]|nr:hypothetical protein [Ignavibacteriales bacterium]
MGGDGWAYDIGYGGLDHVLASGRNVNILVLDTEVYSNTGGQASKATPRAAVAKFAMGGKGLRQEGPRPDRHGLRLRLCRPSCHGRQRPADPARLPRSRVLRWPVHHHRLQPLHRARLSTCAKGLDQQKLAVQSGHWPMYRYDPRLAAEGKNPLVIESKEPSIPISQYAYNETRYKMLTQTG